MPTRTIHLLHVEDDVAQQQFLAHHLAAMNEFAFDIHCVESEATAIQEFDKGHIDLVVLDYRLSQGDGLSCLRALRWRDQMVPIIAISGVATDEIAAELLEAGADDYIDKKDLTSSTLAHSVRESLIRAEALRKRMAGRQV